ncbi:hypothetical protein CGRA01v4_01199 [Colletotrichum graminicola]|nr:hypothetical protein CGRA01v4_01199 [Colletotrichum graminicola]
MVVLLGGEERYQFYSFGPSPQVDAEASPNSLAPAFFSLYFPHLFSCPLLSLPRWLLFFSFWNSIPPLHTRGVPNEGRKVPKNRCLEPALVLARAPAQGGNNSGKGAAKREKKTSPTRTSSAWVWVNGGAPCCAIGGGPGGGTAYLDCRPLRSDRSLTDSD